MSAFITRFGLDAAHLADKHVRACKGCAKCGHTYCDQGGRMGIYEQYLAGKIMEYLLNQVNL